MTTRSLSHPLSVTSARKALIVVVVLILLAIGADTLLSVWLFDDALPSAAPAIYWYIVFDLVLDLAVLSLSIFVIRRFIGQLAETETALHTNEERLQHITSNIQDLICEIDAEDRYRYASPSYRTVLGYAPDELIGCSALEYTHPDDISLYGTLTREALKHGDSGKQLEIRLRHQDGHYLWFESTSQLVQDAQGQYTGAVLVNRDVSGRKRAEEALSRYAHGMRALYETSLEINAQPDVATLLQAVVQRAITLAGTSMGRLYLVNGEDQSLLLVASMPPHLVGTLLQNGKGLAGRAAQSGAPLVIADYSNWPERAQQYEGLPLGRTLSVPLNLRGRIIGVLSVEDEEPGQFSEEDMQLVSLFADQVAVAIENRQLYEQAQHELLVRRQAEDALRRSEQRYRILIENQGEGICFVDEHENLTFANPAANEIFGVAPASLEGHNLSEFLLPEDYIAIRRETEIRRTGQTSTYETRIIRADGQPRTLLITARPRFDEDGTFLGAFSVFRDVTERKQAEEELARTRVNLEHSNQQLTQIMEAGNLLRMNLNLDAVLQEIVQGAYRALNYNMVVLNLLEEASQQMVVHSYAGLDQAGQQALAGGVYDWDEERRLLRAEFRLGRAYFIPHGVLDWQHVASGPMYVPDLPVSEQADAWHPDDVLFIPIELRDGRIAGTIWLDAPQDGKRPTIESLRPLEIFVNQAAIAIENARLFESERQHRCELEAVYSASLQLTQSLGLAEVLDAILHRVMQLVPATSTQLFLYDREHLTFGSGLSEHGQKLAWPPAEPRAGGLTYTVARTGQALFIEDTLQHDIFNAGSRMSPPLMAVAALPLKVEATVLGVMNVSYSATHRFDESERRILSLFAAQAAIAVHNARLHQQVHSYALELEQRVAERTVELERERQHLQAILDSAGEGIQLMAPDGRIAYVNPATERLTGYTADEMLGQMTRLWSSELNSGERMSSLRDQLRQGRAWQGEIINRRRDGTVYESALTITPLKDHHEEVTGYVVVHRDISRFKELEHLKDQFVSRIGHELRTPIANIKLYVHLLERGKFEKQAEYLQTIYREIQRLTHLNDSFLEMSELDAGRTAWQSSPVNIQQLLTDILRDRERQAEQRSLQLVLNDRTRPVIAIDRAWLARAISNILDNALHYAPQGATITISLDTNEISVPDWHSIAVHNTGPGLAPEEVPHMFERFYRGEAARDYRVPGAGLGLAIAQSIVQRLNGRLTVDSLPGRGVTFTLWLRASATPDSGSLI